MSSDSDPLGARHEVVEVDQLTRWNFTQLPEYKEKTEAEKAQPSPFPWRNDLNAKIVLWEGDPTLLNVHALVNSSNEALNDKNPLSDRIFRKAGKQLTQEVNTNLKDIIGPDQDGAKICVWAIHYGRMIHAGSALHSIKMYEIRAKGCRTGEAKITKGYGLLARYVIHTVGPRYNVKYLTAAESALYSCYRNVLQLSKENGIRSLALCNIHTLRRGYPLEDGAHIGTRTVRRFLEKYGDSFDTIIFVMTEGSSKEIYRQVLPLYFPRNHEEEVFAVSHLPPDLGNEDGEPVIPDRQIRILDKPTFAAYKSRENDFEETIDLNQAFGTSTALDVGHHPFAKMESDVDKEKKASVLYGKNAREQQLLEQKRRYERLLKRARTCDLAEIAALRCLYLSGVDRYGRHVVVFIGKHFTPEEIDLDKALMYFVHVMDPIVERDYVIVYFHTLTTARNRPDSGFMKDIYSLVDHKYRKNLKAFYIVHPTFWSRLSTWFFTTFTASDIKNKVRNLPGIEYLYTRINPDQLDIPPFVMDYDMQINGTRYYVPGQHDSVDNL